jgi:hypothetical protein
VLRALAGIIQNRQNADYEHRYGEDDQYGGFHCDLATAGLPNTYRSRFFVVQNEPAVNSVYSPGKLRASAPQKEIAPNIKTTTNTKASNRPTALVIVRSSLIARIWALARGLTPTEKTYYVVRLYVLTTKEHS